MKALVAVGLLAAGVAQADSSINYIDGNNLYGKLTGESIDLIFAYGYISGVSDTGQGVTHCADRNVTIGQITDMVKQHLTNYPQDRHYQADNIVIHVLKGTWPCSKGKSL